MTSREGQGPLRPEPLLRGALLALLVLLLSCGVVAMHSLGSGHLAGIHTLSADLGPTMSAAHTVEPAAPNGGTIDRASGSAPATSPTYDGQRCEPCGVEAAHSPDTTDGHSGLAMCLAVLSLLAWAVLRWRGRPFRTVPTLTRTSARAFTKLVRGPPRLRAPSLSELCICRT